MENLKNKGGRPRSADEDRRDHKVVARLTKAELDQVEALELELGLNRTELVRMRLLDGSEKVLVNSKEITLQLDAVGAELGRSGNNINQLARHANVMNMQGALGPKILEDYLPLLEDHNLLLRKLETSIRQVIRMMSR